MAKTAQNRGETRGGILSRLVAWLFGPRRRDLPTENPNAERIFLCEGVPDERKGYYRLNFEREDGVSFTCVIDAAPARKLSDDLMRAAVQMTLAIGGDRTKDVDRLDQGGFDIDAVRAKDAENERERAEKKTVTS